jgi:endonuclease YncB( thermonuclease family)
MGTVHRFDRARRRRSRLPALFLFLGILPLLAAVVAPKTLWSRFDFSGPRPAAANFVRVIDGDTLYADGKKIRLIDIDAPESDQTCLNAQEREWLCGQAAKKRLIELVSHGGVACTPHGHDRYGRTLAICSAGKISDLGEALVSEGYAVNYGRAFGNYITAEIQARFARRGLWQGQFERPQDWRRSHPRGSYVRKMD